MKKIVFLSLVALTLPFVGMMAQSNDDDLYFIPSKEKKAPVTVNKAPERREVPATVYSPSATTVVVRDRKGNTRNVDEYNRRYDARDNEFALQDDTLYINEKQQPDLDGQWINGEFDGSDSDYEFAERIIRFRNPRYAISISSPLYWDVVYGSNPLDWNIYDDGMYAYAFPTVSNRLWWDWRFNSYGPSWGFGFGSPYYGAGWYGGWGSGWYGGWGNSWYGGWYGGWHSGWYGGGWYGGGWGWGHHHGYYPGWGGGSRWSNRTYTNRRSTGNYAGSSRRSEYSGNRQSETSNRRSSTTNNGRVVGTRVPSGNRSSGNRSGSSTRVDNTRPSVSTGREGSTRRSSTYTRPSSTRSSSVQGVRSNTTQPRSSTTQPRSSFNRGSSATPSRSSTVNTNRRPASNSSSTRSYSPSNSGSSSRSSSSFSGGGSSRSSGGGGGSSRSSGGRR